jgi:hypothetical protein
MRAMTAGVLFSRENPILLAVFHSEYLQYGVLGLVGLGVVLVIVFLVVMVIVCLVERQYLIGDVEPASEPFPYPPSSYWKVTREYARLTGFQHAGDFATRKNTSLVKGLQSLFLNHDRTVILAVFSGASAVGKLKKTVLRTQFANGRILESSDQSGLEDLSGLIQREVLLNAGVEELLDFHERRVRATGTPPVPFKPGAGQQEYDQMDLDRGARWVLMGLAYWVNPEKTIIRMTVRGTWAHLKSMVRQMRKLGSQSERTEIRRAG